MLQFDPVEYILEKIKIGQGLTSMPEMIKQILNTINVGESLSGTIDDLTSIISKDFPLTQKIIALANTDTYSSFSKDGVQSLTAAISILGTKVIGLIALGAKTIENGANKNSPYVKEITKSSYVSTIVNNTVADEDITLSALFFNTGKILVSLYFEKEYIEVEALVNIGVSENNAAQQTIGMTYAELGKRITSHWKFPQVLIDAAANQPSNKELVEFVLEASELVFNGNKKAFGNLIHTASAKYNFNASAILSFGETKIDDTRGVLTLEEIVETIKANLNLRNCILFVRVGHEFKLKYGYDKSLTFAAKFSPTIFHLALHKRSNILLNDLSKFKMDGKFPEWYNENFAGVQSCMVLSIFDTALLYVDKDSGIFSAEDKAYLNAEKYHILQYFK